MRHAFWGLWLGALCLAALVFVPRPVEAVLTVDLSRVRPLPRLLLGQVVEVPSNGILQSESKQRQIAALSSGLRGPVSGLVVDFYNWRAPFTPLMPLPPAKGTRAFENVATPLEFLRLHGALGIEPVFSVNARGYPAVFRWLPPIGDAPNPYVVTDTQTLARDAADLLTYTNETVQRFTLENPPRFTSSEYVEAESARIVGALDWGAYPLLPPEGARLPQVRYWLVGNEPNFPLDGFALNPQEFAARYAVLAGALVEQDQLYNAGKQTIAVGPSLMNLPPENEFGAARYAQAIVAAGAPLDVVGFHPYGNLYGRWYVGADGKYHSYGFADTPAEVTPDQVEKLRENLSGLYAGYAESADALRIATNPKMPLLASEWNPSSWEASFYLRWRGQSMAQALAVFESVFSFGRLRFVGAHYHTDPLMDNPQSALGQAFALLHERMGDQLLAWHAGDCFRVYVTRDSVSGQVGVWGLNWCEDARRVRVDADFLGGGAYLWETRGLAGESLLHGGAESVGAPSPYGGRAPARLSSIQFFVLNPQIVLEIPANGWQAVFLTPLP